MSEPSETIIHDLAASGLVCVCDAEACTEQRRKLVAIYGKKDLEAEAPGRADRITTSPVSQP